MSFITGSFCEINHVQCDPEKLENKQSCGLDYGQRCRSVQCWAGAGSLWLRQSCWLVFSTQRWWGQSCQYRWAFHPYSLLSASSTAMDKWGHWISWQLSELGSQHLDDLLGFYQYPSGRENGCHNLDKSRSPKACWLQNPVNWVESEPRGIKVLVTWAINRPFPQDTPTHWLQGTCPKLPTQAGSAVLVRGLVLAASRMLHSRENRTDFFYSHHVYPDLTHWKVICLWLWPLDRSIVCRTDSALLDVKLTTFRRFSLRKSIKNWVQEFQIKLNIPPLWPSNFIPRDISKRRLTCVHKNTSTRIFITVLLIINPNRKQPKCLITGKYISKRDSAMQWSTTSQ